MRYFVGIAAYLLFTSVAVAGQHSATVVDSPDRVTVRREREQVLLNVREAAQAFGWEAKPLGGGTMIALCRQGKGGLCVPLRLEETVSRQTPKALFVEASVLAEVLGFTTVDVDGELVLKPTEHRKGDSQLPAYQDKWERGRGFQVGQTVPDIPLYDLEGNEVRFSKFLGKRYIIYCWASW